MELLTRVIFCQNVPDEVVLVLISLLVLQLVVVKVMHDTTIAVGCSVRRCDVRHLCIY